MGGLLWLSLAFLTFGAWFCCAKVKNRTGEAYGWSEIIATGWLESLTMSKRAQLGNGLQRQIEEAWATRQKVFTVGGEMTTDGWELDFHSHKKAQLLLALSGVVTCEVENGIWIVPPRSAIFIPGGIRHRLTVAGKVHCYVTLIRANVGSTLPPECMTITVTALLRELIVRSSEFPSTYKTNGPEARTAELLLDEIRVAQTGDLHLPMPSDARLRLIYRQIMANPADRGTLDSWARHVGIGKRTLARIITDEAGMSFGRWRQHLHVMLALQRMAGGSTVQEVALDLGYESAGSFVTMFRKALGTSPGRYMSERAAKH
jgi:AraC-like DNA-binding protein/mannose-6-phosphate isomerase-like protein (cupin superfamily)